MDVDYETKYNIKLNANFVFFRVWLFLLFCEMETTICSISSNCSQTRQMYSA